MLDNYLYTTYCTPCTHYCTYPGCCSHTYNSKTWSYVQSPQIVYKFQIACPSCKTFNWLELDKVAPCTKCHKTLKAVQKKVDYEVEIVR